MSQTAKKVAPQPPIAKPILSLTPESQIFSELYKTKRETGVDHVCIETKVYFPDGRIWHYTRVIDQDFVKYKSLIRFYTDDLLYEMTHMEGDNGEDEQKEPVPQAGGAGSGDGEDND